MPKAILEFNLLEESNEYLMAVNASKYYAALSDISNWIRTEIKHNDKELEEVRSAFYDILDCHNINLDEIA
jgi:hypothetical protein